MRTSKQAVALIGVVWLSLLLMTAVLATADGTISANGTVNAIKAAERKINITHGPIPELDWPGMTMDFAISKAVSLEKVEVGAAVVFELHKEADGSFVIESLKPMEKPAHSHGH